MYNKDYYYTISKRVKMIVFYCLYVNISRIIINK